DVDNGPDGIVREGNERLYTRTGIGRARDALKPGGVLAIWSAAPDHKFTGRLKDAGLEVDVQTVRARANNKGPHHTIWFARRTR
ncbi:MAG: spermidine synthase, partial [Sphingomonadaceae bacterium]|nr:spermidine synthase [Sphingomonadaceae bacterium]